MKKNFKNGPLPQIYAVEGILNDCDMSMKQLTNFINDFCNDPLDRT